MQSSNRKASFPHLPLGLVTAASLLSIALALGTTALAWAQAPVSEASDGQTSSPAPIVPQQVRFSGKLASHAGETVEAVFRLYATPEGGDPLWTETQHITVMDDGAYSVLLGAASPTGLPQTLFADGAPRWLAVSVDGVPEQERTLLPSVPYAMKSADSESLSGHPAGDFVTQQQMAQWAAKTEAATSAVLPDDSGTVTGSGTAGTIPLWTGTLTQGDSIITQSGSEIGINQATPTATLDVGGSENVRGILNLPPVATATASIGQHSQLLELGASAWSSSTNAAVTPIFKLLTNFINNDTSTATGQLELHFEQGPDSVSVLSIANNGVINFAPKQTFPGTIASVAATSPLTATTTSGAVSLGLNTSALESTFNSLYAQLGAANTFTKPITFASGQTFPGAGTLTGITAGTGLTGGGTSGTPTLAIDSSLVPLLNTENTFSNNNTFAGTIGSQGTLDLESPGVTAPYAPNLNSALLELSANAYNSNSGIPEALNFAWQSVASGGNSASPTANLELLYGTGSTAPAATGLSIAPNGVITFASGQTFPGGGGGGTITGITTSSPLTGSGTSGSVNLGLSTSALETTLNAVYAQTGARNSFTGLQYFTSSTSDAIEGYTSAAGSSGVSGQSEYGTSGIGVSGTGDTGVSGSSVSGIGVMGQTGGNGGVAAVQGTSTASTEANNLGGIGVAGNASGIDSYGVYGSASTGVYGTGTAAGVQGYSTASVGVSGQSTASQASGVLGVSSTGENGYGVFGIGDTGVKGVGNEVGVAGIASSVVPGSVAGEGVYGQTTATASQTRTNLLASAASEIPSAGVWGDFPGSSSQGAGVIGTADESFAVLGYNNSGVGGELGTFAGENLTTSKDGYLLWLQAPNTGESNFCFIDTSADLSCAGTVTAVVPVDNTRRAAMYSVQSPENWFEDFGSGQLTAGVAHIAIEPGFAQTINAGVEYHVFLTPDGDCKGLYVAARSAAGFDVRELGGGKSDVAFDYRIVARRKGYEAVRMEDLTDRTTRAQQSLEAMTRNLQTPSRTPAPSQAMILPVPPPPASPRAVPQRTSRPKPSTPIPAEIRPQKQ